MEEVDRELHLEEMEGLKVLEDEEEAEKVLAAQDLEEVDLYLEETAVGVDLEEAMGVVMVVEGKVVVGEEEAVMEVVVMVVAAQEVVV